MSTGKRSVLVIGGGFAGFVVARHMRKHFDVTLIDAKEYFEYTPGILRAFVHPEHLSSLTFKYQPVLEGKMGVRFIWGEVTSLGAYIITCATFDTHPRRWKTYKT